MERGQSHDEHVALITNHHLGYGISNSTKDVPLNIVAQDVRRNITSIMDDLWRRLSFGVGRCNNELMHHELLDYDLASSLAEEQQLRGSLATGDHWFWQPLRRSVHR